MRITSITTGGRDGEVLHDGKIALPRRTPSGVRFFAPGGRRQLSVEMTKEELAQLQALLQEDS